MRRKKRICFVTGTRAEFGLMETTLRAIQRHRQLELQIIATGMHLDRSRGFTLREIRRAGFDVDSTVAWSNRSSLAAATGQATDGIARTLDRLKSDIVLVVGDRVEAFAGASAGTIDGRVVAHVHGGDRALGQLDDSLRHAITKLAHVHFAASRSSAARILRLGEQRFRVHNVGAPGIDNVAKLASKGACDTLGLSHGKYALLAYHPTIADDAKECRRAGEIVAALRSFPQIAIILPNNDPGAAGIVRQWKRLRRDSRVRMIENLARADYLGLLSECAVLVGNSSSGIIEAASFGVPVIDVGDRLKGRESGANVLHVPLESNRIERAASRFLRRTVRFPRRNPYGGRGTSRRIADILANLSIDDKLLRKLISY